MWNGAWSRRKSVLIRCPCSLSVLLKTPDRLLSRFFLHLRSIYIDRHAIVPSQTGASSTRTHPFGRGANRLTGGVSIKLETETNIYDKFPNQNERGIPPVETVDFEAAMELRARHHEDLDL